MPAPKRRSLAVTSNTRRGDAPKNGIGHAARVQVTPSPVEHPLSLSRGPPTSPPNKRRPPAGPSSHSQRGNASV